MDEWTPFLTELKERVSSQGRKRLLFQCIGELQDISMLNFGQDGLARPSQWQPLQLQYAIEYHDGDQTPTLILTGEMRESFVHTVTEDSATLTNTREFADEHQFGNPGRHLPARPYYP